MNELKLALQVSEEVKQETTDCEKNFSCLKGIRKDLCSVEYFFDVKAHFIKCLNQGYCFYQQSYGDGYVCICQYVMSYTISTKYEPGYV